MWDADCNGENVLKCGMSIHRIKLGELLVPLDMLTQHQDQPVSQYLK